MVLATVAHFNQVVMLWCEFGLCVISCRLYHGTFLYKLNERNSVKKELSNICDVTHLLFAICHFKKSSRRGGGWKKTVVTSHKCAERQCAIWDNTILVEISALQNKCTVSVICGPGATTIRGNQELAVSWKSLSSQSMNIGRVFNGV